MTLMRLLLALLALALAPASHAALLGAGNEGDFPLATQRSAAPFFIEPGVDRAISRAADDLRADIESVTGTRPEVLGDIQVNTPRFVVLAGIVGHSPAIDRLASEGKLDISHLTGAWESFVITVVPKPFPGIDQALVIAGSDRRGTIFGLYELSSEIGVSPWHWWADVPPAKKSSLAIAAGAHRFGPPSVKYRGVFLNDEDWGLQPWAAKTFEPETGDIGPKTYAKLFELLLRLKANTVWPAMHQVTHAFNHYPLNKQVADDYAIVMGSSHAEPMLRNNVDEWKAPKETYNFVTNRPGVLGYWEQRVAENGRFENIYTLGMRGIHDSDMLGPKTDAERIRALEQIFADQRALIARHVRPEVDQVPQMFCAYKEVLDLYRQGLRVPEDVTIVWPDDNFGYVRNFATPSERSRSGGFGVYYHLSYLGRPMSYLWLSTTPPALVWEEMHKAYEQGADRIWIANVGDLKPAEIPTDFFLQMAWDIKRWRTDNLPDFLPEWSTRAFGAEHAREISSLLADYYLLNFQRKPEHLQWWMPKQERKPSALTDAEVQARLDAFAQLRRRTETLRASIPATLQDAFYELVAYPIIGSALANQRFFEGERGNVTIAKAANAELIRETRYFNESLAGGKWRRFMSLEPADAQWASMRISPWTAPDAARHSVPSPTEGSFISLNAAHFTSKSPGKGVAWTIVPGLGRTGEAITVLPTTFTPVPLATVAESAPRLDYAITLPAAGEFTLQVQLLPTHPITGSTYQFAISLDDEAPRLVSLNVNDGGPAWARGVLDAVRIATTPLVVSKRGAHTLHLYGTNPGIVIDKLVIDLGDLAPTYLGPTTKE